MDPLSIAASAAGVITMCIQVGQTLYGFVSDTHALDYNIAALHNEILGISHVLQAIEKKWKNHLMHDSRDGLEELWLSVLASIHDCQFTLEKLESKLKEVQESNRFLGHGFLRKPAVAAKLNLNMKDILAFKQRVSSHHSAMQSALAMINFCLLLQNNSSQDSMARKLSEIQLSIIGIENALQTEESPGVFSSDMPEDDGRIYSNLRKLVKEAESFHSNASSVVEIEKRSTRWDGSVLGQPLSDEQLRQIQNWIPPPDVTTNQYDDSFSSRSRLGTQEHRERPVWSPLTAETQITEPSIDRDSGPDNNTLKRLHTLAVSDDSHADSRKAQVSLSEARSRSRVKSSSPLELATEGWAQANTPEAARATPNPYPQEQGATKERPVALERALTSQTRVEPSASLQRPLQREIIKGRSSTDLSFPHALERWETLSSHWEGLTSHWIRRMQEMDLGGLSVNQQLFRQVNDLSAAGANLFHAVTELQRLRAGSERKFQRWFHETRAEREEYQERIARLEAELNEARQNRPPSQQSSKNDVEVLELAQRNAKQMVEERIANLQRQTEEETKAEN